MALNNKDKIRKLLKGIETGDPTAVSAVNEAKYIQHNPQTHEGSEGLAVLFARLSKTNPRVNVARIFEDGDFVFAHMEYDFSARNIGFEIFRFEEGLAVEHWDNIQRRKGPNSSGHSMVDGEVDVVDKEITQSNRSMIQTFVESVLIQQDIGELDRFFKSDSYTEHSPNFGDDLSALRDALSRRAIRYEKCHRVLADGNFVLSVCEGSSNEIHSSFFDLFRLENGKIIEHWDTTEAIPSREKWKNNNGKF